jgi:hypothetical protein
MNFGFVPETHRCHLHRLLHLLNLCDQALEPFGHLECADHDFVRGAGADNPRMR